MAKWTLPSDSPLMPNVLGRQVPVPTSNEQSSPEILLFLDKVKAEQYTSQYQTIALRIKNTGVCLYSDKPKDKQLLAPAEKRLPDAPIGHVGNYQHPAQPAKLIG